MGLDGALVFRRCRPPPPGQCLLLRVSRCTASCVADFALPPPACVLAARSVFRRVGVVSGLGSDPNL